MKNRWVKFALILSATFNIAFLGALGYRLLENREKIEIRICRTVGHKGFECKEINLRPRQIEGLEKIRMIFRPKVREIKDNLVHERNALGCILLEECPDTIVIEEQLKRIGKLQMDIEREVIYQMLKEKKVMDPDQQDRFLNIVTKRLKGETILINSSSKNLLN